MNLFKSIIVGSVVALGVLVGYATTSGPATAADCSGNAVITCGVSSIDQLRQKYNSNTPAGTQNIFSYFGLTSGVVNGASYKTGYVTKAGEVVADGKVVGKNAISAGRHYMPGSTQRNVGGTTFYTRPTTTSFASNSLSAIVFFDAQGRLIGAVLHDCGNPIKADNTVIPPAPIYRCDSLTPTKISRTEYKFTTAATAKNGAAISSYTYNFGDGTTKAAGSTVNHTYTKPGTYKVSVTVRVTVDGKTVTAPGTCVATVTVAPEMCPVPGKEQYPKNDPRCVEDKPAIEVSKLVNKAEHAKVKVGEIFTYQITVKNTGNVALKNTTLTDRAPAEVTLLKTSAGSIKDNTWTYTLSELAVGASKTYTITATYNKFVSGTHTNTVCVETPIIPTTNPDGCDEATTETYEYITVCDLTDNTVKTIGREDYDESHMTTDQTKCGSMHVCVITTKVVKDIAKKDFDPKTMTTDVSKCAPEPITPPAPSVPELPHTGIADGLAGAMGLASLAGVGSAYVASRRSIR